MTKEELLQSITASAQNEWATREEVLKAYDDGSIVSTERTTGENQVVRHLGLAEILYYLGGGIVVLGTGIFIEQNWESLNMLTRILSTMGVGIVTYFVGVIFSREGKSFEWGQAFHLISACTLPIGLFVTLDQFGVDLSGFGYSSLIFALLFGLYLVSYHVFAKNIFVLFSVIFGTGFFFNVTDFFASYNSGSMEMWRFMSYQFLVTGLAYVLLGYAFVSRSERTLTKYLYSFGLLFFFGAALALGGWNPEQYVFWELIFPGLALGATFLSLPLRSRAFLFFGSLFLVLYILKITGEYFTDSLGWPLALVLAGLALVAVGAVFVRLNKRYRER